MPRSRSDISNNAIRIFLQDVGQYYDRARGLEPYASRASQTRELLEFFGHACCYCGRAIDKKSMSEDHLIPINKEHLGLHAWGNVVPCCLFCNNEKQQRPWQEFLDGKAGLESGSRTARLRAFVESKKYDPALNLQQIAGNLYQDVGAVAMTLIDLRYKQAQEAIQAILRS